MAHRNDCFFCQLRLVPLEYFSLSISHPPWEGGFFYVLLLLRLLIFTFFPILSFFMIFYLVDYPVFYYHNEAFFPLLDTF
jgi:hypothetical protein